MMNNYNSLGRTENVCPENGVGGKGGSSPALSKPIAIRTWFVMMATFMLLVLSQNVGAQSLANYTFSSGTSGSLDPMSGATALVGSGSIVAGYNDDNASALVDIGFTFYFMGTPYTQFSVNSNGQIRLGGTTVSGSNITSTSSGVPLIVPMAGDNSAGFSADAVPMSYVVTGSSPNRVLKIQWKNFQIPYNATGTVAGDMQAWLYESGRIDFVYGGMYNNSTSSASRSIFLASSNTATTAGYVTVGASPTFTLASSPTTNSFTASSNIANLYSAADGSRRVYTFTPNFPSAPSDPISLLYSAITPSSMTVNWVDNSTSETYFIVTRATDAAFTQNVVTSVVASTTAATTGNSYNSPQSGLIPGTTYYYKVQSSNEATSPSAGVSGSQATAAGAVYYWTGVAGGADFNTATNWAVNSDGTGGGRTTPLPTDTLIIDGAGTTAGTACTITLAAAGSCGQLLITNNTAVTIQSTSATQRTITINGGAGDDFSIPSGSTLNLTNANPAAIAFAGSGNVGTIAGTYNSGGSTSNLITTANAVVTVTSTGIVNNNIVGASGCFSGSATTLIFSNGSNYNLSGFTTGNGYFPTATWGASSNVTVTGGTTATSFTGGAQSFGNFTYNATGSTGTMSAWTSSTVTIQGDLTIQSSGTGIFRAATSGAVTINGNVNVTGGTLQSNSNSSGTFTVLGNTTIGASGKIDINAGSYSERGSSFTNNGVLTGVAGTLNMYSPTNAAQTLAGSGTVLTNVGALGVQTTGGLTITHANQIPVLRVNLFNGTITNSNKLTMGTGASSAVVGQIGYAGNTAAGGSFDVSPTWNLGTGTYTLFYAQESAGRTTGFEIPPTRTVNTATLSNTNGLTVSGGGLGIASLTMSANAGNITTTGSNLLTITGTTTGSLTRTAPTGYINGPLALTLPASLASGSTYTFPIGKGSLNQFALVNPVTNAGGAVVVKAEVFDANSGGTPGSLMASLNTNRYWAASIVSGGGNFTSSAVQLTDSTTGADAIAASATQGGAYDLAGGTSPTVTATAITTGAPALTSLPGFFVMGAKASATLSNLAISPSGTQCTNVARTVTVTVTPGGAAITGVVINYSFNGVAQTPVSMTNTSGNDWSGTIPTATPANATVAWSVTATDANTLQKTLAGTTYSDEPNTGVVTTAASSKSSVCQGDTTVLTASVVKPATAIVGAGSSTVSDYSNPFYSNWSHTQQQILIKASELAAAGLSAGNITALSLTINSGTTNMPDFSLAMQNTSLTALSGLTATGWTSVYTNATGYTPVVGNNTITFSTPFSWDGTSNVLLKFCWGNSGSTATISSTAVGDTTSYVCSVNAHNTSGTSGSSICSSTSVYLTYSSRPKFTFTGNLAVTPTAYVWKDSSNNTVGTTNPLTITPSGTSTYTVTVTTNGCPISATTSSVAVNPLPTAPTATNSSQCGNQVPMASVADTNGFTTPTFNWYAASTGGSPLQSSTSTTYTTAISSTTTFYVAVVNGSTGCESARTPVTVTVSTPDAVSASASSSTICLGQSITLTGANTASSPTQNYSYSWSSTAGSGAATPVEGNPAVITPTAAGTYTYTVTATDGGCVATNTVSVTVNATPTITANASQTTICEGTSSTLSAVVSGNGNVAIGAGALTSSSSGSSGANTLANPFNHYFGGIKEEYLFTASELTAAGLQAGNITALSFDVTTAGITYNSFNLSIGTTAASAVTTTFTTGLTSVFTGNLAVTSTGLKTIAFSAPFAWDGTSNLVVQICWSNANTGGTAAEVKYDTTSFASTLYNRADSQTASAICGATATATPIGVGGTANARPKMVFAGVAGTTSGYTFTWNPGNLSGANQTVSPSATTVYTVNAQNNTTGCSNTQTVTVNVNPQPTAPIASNSTQCGAGVPTASVSDPNGFTTPTFVWYSAATGGSVLQTGTSNVYTTSVSATTTFYVSVINPATSCESLRTPVTVTFTAADPITITPSTTTPCEDTAFTLGASSANAGYTYTWTASPAAGSGIPTSMTGASISVTPTDRGTYVYTVSGTDGNCTATKTVTISVTAPIVVVTASPDTICAGNSATLTATTPVVAAGTVTIGSGTSRVAHDAELTIFNNRRASYHIQLLYTAAELTAAGVYPGNITALTFNIDDIGSSADNTNFTVKMGTTGLSAFTDYVSTTSFTTVFPAATYTHAVGNNIITFSTPYAWDGTSNIVVDVAMEGIDSLYNGTVSYTPTAANTVAYGYNGAVTATLSKNRFNVGISGQVATYSAGSLVYTWNNGAGSGSSVTVSPTGTTTYTVSAYDSTSGCTATKDVTVTVNPIPTAPVASNSTQCGAGIPTASVSDPNAYTSPTFKWYDASTGGNVLQSSTATTYGTSIAATTTFYVSVTNPTTGCESGRTPVTVTYSTPPAITVAPGSTATGCANQPLAISVSSGNASYVYTWTASPEAGSGITGSVTGASPSIIPTVAGTYVYTVSANDGTCNITGTITATVSQSPSTLNIVQTGNNCSGQVLTLTASGGTAPGAGTIGTGTSLTGDTTELSAFGNRRASYHTQLLFTAAELSAAGVPTGQITSLAFTTNTQGDAGNNTNFVVKMGNTALTALTDYVATTGFTTVFPSATYAHTVGVNTITFSTPFTWNGTSNVIVDMAYSGIDNINNAQTYYTSTAGNTVAYGYNGASTASLSSNRFNTTFGYIAPTSLTWSPTTELYTDASATTPYSGQSTNVVYAKATTNRTYTATATLNSCSTSATTDVNPTALPTFTISNATICKGGSTTLTAVGAGNVYSWSPATGLSATTGSSVTANPTVTTTYTVTATSNSTGCQSSQTVTVTVNDPAVFTDVDGFGIAPLNPTAINGQTVTFTASAAGTGITYQWYVDDGSGFAMLPGETGSSYAVVVDPSMTGYQYHVVVTGTAPCGSITSANATLNVDSTGITGQPQSITVCAGNSAAFTVAASSEDPEQVIGYSWEVSTDAGANWTPVADGADATIPGYTFSGSDTATLSLGTANVAANGWLFHAIVNGYIFSDNATLTVKAQPTITTDVVSDVFACANSGTPVTFSVVAAGDDLTYQWQVSTNDGINWTDLANGGGVAGAQTATLSLSNIPPSADNNVYHVIISGFGSCSVVTSAPGKLHVNNVAITTPPSNVTVAAGSYANFTTVASGTGLSYAWQYFNGTSWSNVADNTPAGYTYTASGPSLTVNVPAAASAGALQYRVIASAGSCSATSAAATLTVATYCTPTSISSTTYYIDSFTTTGGLTNINNASSGQSTNGYGNFTAQSGSAYQGASVNFSTTTMSSSSTFGLAIWIDFDRNGTFDAAERVFSTPAYASNPSGSFVIPASAPAGTTRMRVLLDYYTGSPSNPCVISSTGPYGEVEDYSFTIVTPPACSGTPVAGTLTSSGDVCSSGTSTLTLSGYTQNVTGLSFQWYDTVSGLIAGATGTSYTTPTLTSSASYYVRVTCANGGAFADSNTVTVHVDTPAITGTTPGSRCGTGTVNLSATAASGTIDWYAAASGGAALYTGGTYTTPSISATTTYYVENVVNVQTASAGPVGPAVSTNGTSAGSHGILVTTTVPSVKVISADIPFTGTGTITVALRDASNSTTYATVTSPTVTGNGLTPVTVPLGMIIPSAGNYSLIVTAVSGSVNDLGYSTATFPSSALGGKFVVTGGYWYGSSTSNMYLYNLSVSVGCSSARTAVTATVNTAPALTLSAASASICAGATSSAITVTAGLSDYDTFSWTPSTGVSGSAGSGYTFTGSATTVYTLNASSTVSGCANTTTFTLNVNPLPVAVPITPALSTICTGGVQQLSAGSGSAGGTGTFGTGTTAPGSTSYPNPLSAYYGGVKHQMLFTAAELSAQGLQAGSSINALTFYLNNVAGNACTDFTIRMGATAVTSMSGGFVSGTSTVYGPLTYTPSGAAGLRTFTLTTPYVWDGTSNLIVETVHNAGNGGNGSGTRTRTSTTSFTSVYYGATDNVAGGIPGYDALTSYGSSNSSSSRPNMTFVFTNIVPTWTPTTGLYTNAAATTPYTGTNTGVVYAKPSGNSVYTATFTSGAGCVSTTTATVNVTTAPSVVAPSAQAYCAGSLTSAISLVSTPATGVTFSLSGGGAVGLPDLSGVTSIPSFTAVAGTATVTITPSNSGCNGTPVTYNIVVSPQTVAGTITGGGNTVCTGSNSGLLTLSGNTGSVVRWESSVAPFSVWTPIAATTSTYTSGPLSQTTQFRAVVKSGACVEVATDAVTVTVNEVTLASVTSAQVCQNTEATVALNGLVPNSTMTVAYTQSGVAQTPINLTADASGMAMFNVLVTGAGQNVVITQITRTDVSPSCPWTPTSNNAVTFVLSTGCSNLVAQCGVTLATIDTPINSTIIANAQAYRWRVTNLNGPNMGLVQTLDTNLRTMKLIQLSNYAFATQYQIEVATLRSNVWGPYGVACTVTTPSPTTAISPCGQTLTTISDNVYANIVGFAAGYKFRITDPVSPTNTQEILRPIRDFKLTMVTAFPVSYNKTYNVEVAVKNTDGTYLPYGSVCTITTPVFPTTSISDAQCDDYVVPTANTQIYALSYPGAIKYAFQFTGGNFGSTPVEIVSQIRSFTVAQIPGWAPAQTYDVKVRLIFNDSDLPGPYGKVCTIVTPGLSRPVESDTAATHFDAIAYPNPFAETFDVKVTTADADNVSVAVYDMAGRLLETRTVKVSQVESLHIGDRYPSGVYNVVVTQGEHVKTLRVIKR